jgi:putative endonuclease
MSTKLIGAMGEAAAAEILRKKKYRILSMNYRTRYGEIDIIASFKNLLAFVEVKLRRNRNFAEAFEYVDKRKQAKIRLTAELCFRKTKRLCSRGLTLLRSISIPTGRSGDKPYRERFLAGRLFRSGYGKEKHHDCDF